MLGALEESTRAQRQLVADAQDQLAAELAASFSQRPLDAWLELFDGEEGIVQIGGGSLGGKGRGLAFAGRPPDEVGLSEPFPGARSPVPPRPISTGYWRPTPAVAAFSTISTRCAPGAPANPRNSARPAPRNATDGALRCASWASRSQRASAI